jgi:hypothetical protein
MMMSSFWTKAEVNSSFNRDTMIINITEFQSDFNQSAPGPPLAINNTKAPNFEFLVYPNPVVNILTVKFQGSISSKSEAVYLYVIDLKGRIVIEQNDIYKQGSIFQKEMNIRVLPQGDYIIKSIIGKNVCIKKF